MPDRRPTPATETSPIPSLEEVRAQPEPVSGVAPRAPSRGRALGVGVGAAVVSVAGVYTVANAEAPQCGQTRVDEFSAHATLVERAARRADIAQVVREIGMATGVIRHRSTRVEPDLLPAGAMPVTQDIPVDQPPPPPPQPQLDPPQPVPGGMRMHTPLPEQPVQPTPPPRPRPTVRSHISGGARAVHPVRPGEYTF